LGLKRKSLWVTGNYKIQMGLKVLGGREEPRRDPEEGELPLGTYRWTQTRNEEHEVREYNRE